MNLLITNTREDQAYLILRSLRDVASRIVVTLDGDSWFQRWGSMSAWSRHVSARHRVPDVSADWRAGVIQGENTAGEERYVRRIEEICALERIDAVFPSYDAEVYVFSKNRERLAQQGVTAVVPDFEAVSRILDKSETLAAAARAGFPAPRTRVPADLDEARQAARELSPPWVLKPRCGAHAANIRLARDEDELAREFDRLTRAQDRPLLQEYVPAETKRNYYLLVDRNHELLSVFTPRVLRTRKTGLRTPCAAVESSHEVPYEREVRGLLRELGVWGGLTLQTIVDARDGKPKLMEINPRIGHNLWFRTELGINEPLMYLRLAHGQNPSPAPTCAAGVLLLDPLWDGLHLLGQMVDRVIARLRRIVLRKDETSDPFERERIGALLGELRAEYFGPRPRILSPLNRGWLSDPLPPFVRILRVLAEALQRRAS